MDGEAVSKVKTPATDVVENLIEVLQSRFHLEPTQKPRRQRAISASFDTQQSQRFKQNILCIISMMLACPPSQCDSDATVAKEGDACATHDEGDKNNASATCDGSILNEMLLSVAGALTDNHQPQYIPASVVHSTLSVYKTMTLQELSFRMSDLRNLTPEQQVMYTHNQDVIDELCSEPEGGQQKSVYCYKIKEDGSHTIGCSFETQYAVSCSIDYIKKRFDLFGSSRVICCEKYVYLVANSEDLFILSKVIVPYISLILPIHKANYGSSNFLVSPLVVDALATAPPRSKMVKYSMWMLAALLHRTSSVDPIDMLFNELVREGDEVLACLGRTYIIHLLGFQAQKRHDSVAKHMLSNSHRIYFESPHSYEARNDAIRMKKLGYTSRHQSGQNLQWGSHTNDTHDEYNSECDSITGAHSSEKSNECGHQSHADVLACLQSSEKKRTRDDYHSDGLHHAGADTEDIPDFTEQDEQNYKREQEDKCVAFCAIKDMCLMANRAEKWCISANALDRLIGSFEDISALPSSLAQLRHCVLDGFQDHRYNVVKDVVVNVPTSGFAQMARPDPGVWNPGRRRGGIVIKRQKSVGDSTCCKSKLEMASTSTKPTFMKRERKPNGRMTNVNGAARWSRQVSLHRSLIASNLKKHKATEADMCKQNPDSVSPASISPGSVDLDHENATDKLLKDKEKHDGSVDVLIQDTNHVSDSDSDSDSNSVSGSGSDSETNSDSKSNAVGCTVSGTASNVDNVSCGSNATTKTCASANRSIASRHSLLSGRSGKTTTSRKSRQRNYVVIPPDTLSAFLFDLLNYPSFSYDGDRFGIKRKVTLKTGHEDAYNFLYTKNPAAENMVDPDASKPPMPPDFNGAVATDSSGQGVERKKKLSREAEGEYKRLYTEALFTETESKNTRSRKATEAQMQWQLNCLLSMQSSAPPKGASALSVQQCALHPVNRKPVRYEYKMVAIDKLNLTRVERGWICMEALLCLVEELIRNFFPMSHRIQGVHSVPRLHLTTRTASQQAKKRLRLGKNHAFIGGAYLHGLPVELKTSSDVSPSDVIPLLSKPKLSRDAIKALSSCRWGQLFGYSYLHSLGANGTIVPWQIQSQLLERHNSRARVDKGWGGPQK